MHVPVEWSQWNQCIICVFPLLQTCKTRGLTCKREMMNEVNTCSALESAFECHGCETSLGSEQPAWVVDTAPSVNLPNKCLITSDPWQSDCASAHHLTIRLCPCA